MASSWFFESIRSVELDDWYKKECEDIKVCRDKAVEDLRAQESRQAQLDQIYRQRSKEFRALLGFGV